MAVQFLGAALTENKLPMLTFRCECGEKSSVILDFSDDSLEFAFTCDECMSSHWLIISRKPKT